MPWQLAGFGNQRTTTRRADQARSQCDTFAEGERERERLREAGWQSEIECCEAKANQASHGLNAQLGMSTSSRFIFIFIFICQTGPLECAMKLPPKSNRKYKMSAQINEMKLGKNKLARILHKFKQKFSLDYRKNLWLKISKKKRKTLSNRSSVQQPADMLQQFVVTRLPSPAGTRFPDPSPALPTEVLIKRHKKSDVGFLSSIKLSSFVEPCRRVVVVVGGLIIFIIFPFSSLFTGAAAAAVLSR